MKISIWSDFVCSFCYIGAVNLNRALAEFEHSNEVEIEYKSFQLDPNAVYDPNISYAKSMAIRRSASKSKINRFVQHIETVAKDTGLEYHLDTVKNANSLPAHRVLQYAKTQGKGLEFFERLYPAVFTEGELISDENTIIRLGTEIGLDPDEISLILTHTESYQQEVYYDINQAKEDGIRAVPYFLFNDKYAIAGAHSVDAYVQVLKQAYADAMKENGS